MTDIATQRTAFRLLVSPERWARLRALPASPFLQRAAEALAEIVEPWVDDRTITVDEAGHNWHLIRARELQLRVVSLLVMYGRTGDRRYRDAAVDYLRDMAGWEYWSWITWREGKADPNAIFDLSYGENATTLALAYDWLAAELSDEEHALIVETALTRALIPYIQRVSTPGQEDWFYRKADSNWNTVCNGGAGLLAMALSEAAPESARVLELVEEGIRHYFEFMQEDGAWPEGIGYWGYGHRYGYFYLLSHERFTGQPHPLLARPGSRNTLRFPLLFSPNNVPTSFGDVNDFFPLLFHYAAAQRFEMWDVTAELDRRFARIVEEDPNQLNTTGPWPGLAELLLFHPGETKTDSAECTWPRLTVQKGLEWSTLADQWPQPRLYASVRGGTTDAPHTHQDLSSMFVVVGNEPLIYNVGVEDYIDTTFGGRRFELYEMSAASKNVLLVNGVGLPQPATVRTTAINGAGWEGVLLDLAAAMSVGSPVKLCGRAVLMLNQAALLVVDRVTLQHAGLAEARYHTYARVERQKTSAWLRGQHEALHLAFAANVPAITRPALGLPTQAENQPERIIRWLTRDKQEEMVLVTLMTPNTTGRVVLNARKRTIHAMGRGVDMLLRYPANALGIESV